MGGRQRDPLPGHLCARRVRPGDDHHGGTPGPQRGPREPPQLARPQAPHRRRGDPPAREPRRALLPARARRPQRAGHPRAALPRSNGPADEAGEPALRQHEPHAPGGAGLGPHGRELVGQRRGRRGARRAGAQPGRRPLPAARGASPRSAGPAGLRSGRHRAEGENPPLAHRGGGGGACPRLSRGAGARRRPPHRPDPGLRPAGPRVRRAGGRARARGEADGPVHVTGSRDRRAADERDQERRPLSHVRRGLRRSREGLGGALGGLRHPPSEQRTRPVPAAAAHLARPAGLLAPHRASRRRRPGARSQRRGLSRARLLGRALRLSLPQLPAAGDHAGPAHVPLPADQRGARGGARDRLPGSHVPVAERQRRGRGDPARAPQPAVRALGAGPQPQPAPRQRGDLLQHLVLLPRDPRPRVPPRPRRGDAAGDRALLVLHRPLQPGARPVGDPRGHGPGRVPREASGRDRGRPAQQRLHERHGGVDLRDGADGARAAPREPPRCPAGEDRPRRRGDAQVGAR